MWGVEGLGLKVRGPGGACHLLPGVLRCRVSACVWWEPLHLPAGSELLLTSTCCLLPSAATRLLQAL